MIHVEDYHIQIAEEPGIVLDEVAALIHNLRKLGFEREGLMYSCLVGLIKNEAPNLQLVALSVKPILETIDSVFGQEANNE